MSVAFYIVPERDVRGLDAFVNGKALAHCDSLDHLAERAGVRPLSEFLSQEPEDAAAFCESEGVEPPADGFDPAAWHAAEDGLVTVRGLLSYLETHPGAVGNAKAVTDDLREYESVLRALASEGVRWYMAVDF